MNSMRPAQGRLQPEIVVDQRFLAAEFLAQETLNISSIERQASCIV
jgi:hypothetical protein